MHTITVLGDSLLDIDLTGSATRLCPDAPAPVLEDVQQVERPGGAALAATLLARDGCEVALLTPLAHDPAGVRLRNLLPDRVRLFNLPDAPPTATKVRVRAGGQSLVRLDLEEPVSIPSASWSPEVERLLSDSRAVLVSDYGRGATTDERIRSVLTRIVSRVPVVWDPHPRGATPVQGTWMVTPNHAEARSFARPKAHGESKADLREVTRDARRLMGKWRPRGVCVTLGKFGALLSFGGGSPLVVPAPAVVSGDSCGAGDRFSTALLLALHAGALPSEAVKVAVQQASDFVAAGGAGAAQDGESPARTGISALALAEQVHRSGGRVVATGGCFDVLHAGHVAMLQSARSLGECLIVCVNSDESVHRLKGDGRPVVGQEDRVNVLRALACVDAVVLFDEDTPAQIISEIRPDIWAKGGDYSENSMPEAAAVASWGGQAVVLPYLEGRSTTRLLRSAPPP
jgi:rfaE bifunctional protein nucleotidyltransferase chain/domain/rfaE bifunctional protein kinase chain/domain